MRAAAVPPKFLLPGTIVNAPMKGWVGLRHFALVSDRLGIDGFPILVANARAAGGPAEEVWSKFTEGQSYDRAYYPGSLAPRIVLKNAYGMFGTRYNLLSWNCEHFVNACHGLPATSRQVKNFAFAAMIGGLALAAARGLISNRSRIRQARYPMAKTWKKLAARITALGIEIRRTFRGPEILQKEDQKKAAKTAKKSVKKAAAKRVAQKTAKKSRAVKKPAKTIAAKKTAAKVRSKAIKTKKAKTKTKRVMPPPAQNLLPTGEPGFVTPLDQL